MTPDQDKTPRYRSVRLKHYDYSQSGAYFVTICTYNKECIFGDVVNGMAQLNENGNIVKHEWLRTEQLRGNVELDAYVVMPNHFHGIILLTESTARRATTEAHDSTPERRFGKPVANSLATVVGAFKSATTRRINKGRMSSFRVWQPNYYEHIIRSEEDFSKIQEYIIYNALKWALDSENPGNKK